MIKYKMIKKIKEIIRYWHALNGEIKSSCESKIEKRNIKEDNTTIVEDLKYNNKHNMN